MPNNPTPNIQHSTSNEIAISLKNVSKYYKLYGRPKDRLKEALSRSNKTYHKKFYATKNLNLEIKKGEILGIVGKNGSGKSTLLKLITGVLKPDEGTVHINGKISALLELGSGFNPEFTGIQNIFFYGTILGFSKEEMKERLAEILAFADIGDFIDQPLKTYSSGMKSRLGFAVAVHIDPEILILDEVLAVGDVLFRRKCYAKMEEFFKGGKTIIYVSHDANSVKELCTRAIFLDSGNILIDSDAKTVSSYYEKYVFAKAEKQAEILHEIQNLENKNLVKNNKSPSKNIQQSYFIPDFVSPNYLYYSEPDIVMTNPIILDEQNEPVNILIHKKNYTAKVNVEFLTTYSNVSVGIRFNTLKGLYVSGAALYFGDENIDIDSPGTYSVEWEFKCYLLQGDYVIDFGVSFSNQGERVILGKIADGYLFRIDFQKDTILDGIVSLEQKPTIRKVK